ncbi:MAG: alpha/beta fold hydrolase [Parachlamydiaceae bacterium]|nr:alpha/beta fold hydrolase [Parachlamydiaceae bacterium]
MLSNENRESIIINNAGQKIFGVFHRPLTKAKCPAVLICHGLGGNKVGKHRVYVTLAHLLASSGIAALRIDFRGSGDSEGEFSEMTIDNEVSDALQALEFLKNDSQVDSSRIAIFGRSFGGVIAILAANMLGGIKSIGLWAPVFSGEQWRHQWEMIKSANLSPERRDEIMSIDGMKPGSHFFEQLFVLNLKDKVSALSNLPLLHIHGEKDTLVDTGHADHYEKVRENAEGKSKFMRLPNTDHDFSNSTERNMALEESVNWFKATLIPRGS